MIQRADEKNGADHGNNGQPQKRGGFFIAFAALLLLFVVAVIDMTFLNGEELIHIPCSGDALVISFQREFPDFLQYFGIHSVVHDGKKTAVIDVRSSKDSPYNGVERFIVLVVKRGFFSVALIHPGVDKAGIYGSKVLFRSGKSHIRVFVAVRIGIEFGKYDGSRFQYAQKILYNFRAKEEAKVIINRVRVFIMIRVYFKDFEMGQRVFVVVSLWIFDRR